MKGIFYGSSTGNTEELARKIASELGIVSSDMYDVSKVSADRTAAYDLLLLGSSTWGLGDLQDDWADFIERLKKEDLRGKKVGLFGCGDSTSYPDTFCDALGIIRKELGGTGCVFIGEMDASDYPDSSSRAFENGKVVGLAVDDDEPGKTEKRLKSWISLISKA